MSTYKVTGNNVLLKPIPAKEVSRGGITLPMSATSLENLLYRVVAVGPGRTVRKKGREDILVPIELIPGDSVVLDRYHGNKGVLPNEMIVVDANEILARYNEVKIETAP